MPDQAREHEADLQHTIRDPLWPLRERRMETLIGSRRRPNRLVAAVVALMLQGCSPESSPPAQDSTLSPVWTLSAVPVLAIGDDTDRASTFERIAGVTADSHGRILVLDGGAAEVRVFDAHGRYVETWGGRGEGPGEFGAPTLLGTSRGDTLLILDRRNQVVSTLSPTGEPGDWSFHVLDSRNPAPRQALAATDEGRVVVQSVTVFQGGLQEGSVFGDTTRLSLVDPHGGSSQSLGPAAAPRWVWTHEEQVPLPFSSRLSVATRGDSVFTLGADGSTVLVYAPDGRNAVWASPRHSGAVTSADAAAYRAYVAARGMAKEMSDLWVSVLDHPAVPHSKSIYDAVVATDDGEVWARLGLGVGEPGTWDVFTAEGEVRGTVLTPRGLLVRKVTSDKVIGVRRDSLGVESVVVYAKRPERDEAVTGTK